MEHEEFPKEVIKGAEWDNVIDPVLSDGYNKISSDLENKTFKWYCGTVLSGGSVVDEVEQKVKLIEAAERNGIDNFIGGEMECIGVYSLVIKKNFHVRFCIQCVND